MSGSKSSKRILAVSSGGGHWVQLNRLKPAFEGHRVAFATVIGSYRDEVPGHRFYRITDVTRWNKVRWVLVLVQLMWIMLRERPHVVVSTGALPGYFAIRLGKMLGARTIWLDSIANVDELSMAGQRIGKWADLWLTQWPHLAHEGGPSYLGEVV